MRRSELDRRIRTIVRQELCNQGVKTPYQLPPNHNEPWAEEDEEVLAFEFIDFLENAGRNLGRTPRAIYERMKLRGVKGIRIYLGNYSLNVPQRP